MVLTWERPTAPNGLISHYRITAEPVGTAGLPAPLGSTATAELLIEQPETFLSVTLLGLEPATLYNITLTAYTAGRDGGSGPVVTLSTAESGELLLLELIVKQYQNMSMITLLVLCMPLLSI